MDIPGDVDVDYEASGKDGESESNTGTPDIGGVLQALVTQMASQKRKFRWHATIPVPYLGSS